jgi:hypothetical protein
LPYEYPDWQLLNVIEKVLYEDIAVVGNLKRGSVIILKSGAVFFLLTALFVFCSRGVQGAEKTVSFAATLVPTAIHDAAKGSVRIAGRISPVSGTKVLIRVLDDREDHSSFSICQGIGFTHWHAPMM